MYDANAILQSATTATSATVNGTGFDLKTGTPRRGLKARFLITSWAGTGAGGTITPKIQDSTDNTTFVDLAYGPTYTAATAAATAVVFIPFETSKRYVRAVMAFGVTTSVPVVAYSADLGVARP